MAKTQSIRDQIKNKTAVSVPEAAEALGIGLSLAYSQAASGHIGPVRVLTIGRRRVVPTRDLMRALGDEEQ